MKRIVLFVIALIISLGMCSCVDETEITTTNNISAITTSLTEQLSTNLTESNAMTTTEPLTTIFSESTISSFTSTTTEESLTVSLAFDSQGGSVVETITGEPGEPLSEPAAPTKEGYVFAGWYDSPSALTPFVFGVMPTSNTTLYADWATEGLTFTLIDENQAYEVGGQDLIGLELTDVAIPKRHQGLLVKAIASGGFTNYEYLLDIRMPAGIEAIGNNAFNGCDDLHSVYLPDNLETIGAGAFLLCPSLTTIEISPSNQAFVVVDDVLFTKDMQKLVLYPAGSTSTSYEIGSTVKEIGYGAFSYCYFLESVTISNSVETIGERAFYWSANIASIVIPNSVTSVGIYAFSDCYGLESVTIGTGIDTISAYMFNWCNDLSSVIIPANITTIGYGAFSDCHELMSVYIERPYSPGDSIFGASFMFNNTNSLLSIYMPDLDTVNYYKTEATGGWVSFRSRITLAPTE